jgi:hypothetical protein
MKALVMATLYVCLSNGQCEQKQIRVDPRACRVGQYTAEVPLNGEWHPAKVGVKC